MPSSSATHYTSSTSTMQPIPAPPPPTAREKLTGWDLYRAMGSPKYIVAPMVDQSELAYRRLCRQYGAELVYTPMINAKMFTDPVNKAYRSTAFDIHNGEEGSSSSSGSPASTDRPLFVQFCANDPDQLLASAKVVEPYCDAVDLNLGCPQDIAKRGRYGSFLQDDWELIHRLINTLHTNLSIPVVAKFRVFPDIEKTVEYAKMLESAGAQILQCHGRIREQRGVCTGLADWSKIRAVKQSVSVPVFANGNILFHEDIQKCLDETGCDGVSSAEGVLYNAALFVGPSTEPWNMPTTLLPPEPSISNSSPSPSSTSSEQPHPPPISSILTLQFGNDPMMHQHPPHVLLAAQYLAHATVLKTHTPVSAVKGHLFKILRPALAREVDLRERLGRVGVVKKARVEVGKKGESAEGETKEGQEAEEGCGEGVVQEGRKRHREGRSWMEEAWNVVEEMGRRMERNAKEATQNFTIPLQDLITIDSKTGLKVMPWWLAQPYFRAAPPPQAGKKLKKAKAKVEAQAAQDGEGTSVAPATAQLEGDCANCLAEASVSLSETVGDVTKDGAEPGGRNERVDIPQKRDELSGDEEGDRDVKRRKVEVVESKIALQ
ncbi:Dus-domain-containing protein [Coprinopsis sp. MPI-PUGE-AT-0042]|nr:Dus-domain-containing protein [Coprinopsis sp. MPI-PUGE-AT-0042]